MSVRVELESALKIAIADGETDDRYAERVCRASLQLPDERWEKLSPEVRQWTNDAHEALERGKLLPPLDYPTEPEVPTGKRPAGRPSQFPAEAKIRLLVTDNPHRRGTQSFDKFTRLRDGMRVAEAVALGLSKADIWRGGKGERIKVS